MVQESSAPAAAGRSGAGIAIVVVLLLGAAAGILWFVSRKPSEPIKVTSVTSVVPPTAPTTTLDLPPVEAPKDAGEDSAPALDATPTRAAAVGGGGCSATCGGGVTDALKQAVAARAATAKQCYKTALEGNEGLAGIVGVVVRVGGDGSTCSTSIASDTTGSSRLQQCVRSKMIATYPQPKAGCVDVKVDINFKPKT